MDCSGLTRHLDQLDPQRICIIKPSALGDIVQSLPLLPALRERFPRAEISWVAGASCADLLEGHPQLERVIRFERHGGLTSWRQLLQTLQQHQFDLSIDLQGLARTGVMNWATRAPLRVGLE
ncbi:MAG: glycosyltransferase family 9 protein, partial [Planctomycetaceae bacterium]|nr:glycosyltransferase family 9 protein [Planctomycetaceae bacterium]